MTAAGAGARAAGRVAGQARLAVVTRPSAAPVGARGAVSVVAPGVASILASVGAAVVVAGTAAGCVGPSTQISSNRAPEFTGRLSELFVISQAGMDGEVNSRHFEDKLLATGTKCGLRLGVTHMTGLELDPAIHMRRMREFGAHNVLVLRLTGGTKDSGGGIVVAQYDGRLYDAEKMGQDSATMLWRADVRLTRGEGVFGDSGEQLAMDLLRQLDHDRLIAPCAELVDPYAAPENAKKEPYRRR